MSAIEHKFSALVYDLRWEIAAIMEPNLLAYTASGNTEEIQITERKRRTWSEAAEYLEQLGLADLKAKTAGGGN